MTKEEEKALRKKLEKEVPEGIYRIGDILFTGKLGYINFEVHMRKAIETVRASK